MAGWNTNPSWNSLASINAGFKFTSISDISPSDFNKLVENMHFLYTNYLNSEGGELDMKRIYPVGSIYLSLEKTFNPAEQFGGTWAKLTDRFLLGAGATYSIESTGGSADAVVVSHYHDRIKAYVGSTTKDVVSGAGTGVGTALPYINAPAAANNSTGALQTNTTGVSSTGKNMPPYLAVYMWERIA